MEKHVVTAQEAQQRIDKFVRKYLNNTPLSMIYKLFRKKEIRVNDKPVAEDYILKENDEIKIYLPLAKEKFIVEQEYRPIKPNFKIVYEDDNVLVVNKEKGVIVHNAENKSYGTLTDQVITYLVQKGLYDPKKKTFVPAPAHRLDRNTSGLVIYGKNMAALQELNSAFKKQEGLQKIYQVLIVGRVLETGKIELRLQKDAKEKKVRVVNRQGLEALTFYRPLKISEKFSLVEATIKTGRTHQIRAHFAAINHPVVGDKKYGNFQLNSDFKRQFNWENQFLHAHKLIFNNFNDTLKYLNGKIFQAELPNDKKTIIRKIFA
ncbi:RluA family pseudouridine synthase [bacterium]|jgi:23S rRNA pseudouridine955/2504/2580 synthase|nr:RluA family pseudouridine synthase [bacterium]